MKARKLILEIKEEYEEIRLRKKKVLRNRGTKCFACEEEVSWMTIPEASVALGMCTEEVLKLLASTGLHFRIELEGTVLLCEKAVNALTCDKSLQSG